jgi:hypothetical protein
VWICVCVGGMGYCWEARGALDQLHGLEISRHPEGRAGAGLHAAAKGVRNEEEITSPCK